MVLVTTLPGMYKNKERARGVPRSDIGMETGNGEVDWEGRRRPKQEEG